ncbi:MAG: GNAT family N-acetyltransferase [Candidatus Izemoplasmatales bacterium]|nr:GNAT family N-acetyltransferase [Candidatus Izemoplasmatales bacterium]
MEIRLAKTNRDFLSQYAEILEQHAAVTQLFSTNLQGDLDLPLERHQARGGIYEGDCLLLLFLNPIPWNLQIWADDYPEAAIDLLVNYLISESIDIKGVQGNQLLTDRFVLQYGRWTNLSFRTRLAMDIMVLRKLIDVIPKGTPREATMKDIDALCEWEAAFLREALHEDTDASAMREKVLAHLEKNLVMVVEDDRHQLVSMAMASRKMPKGRAISLVYTPPQFRNRGFSRHCVHALCTRLFEEKNEFVSLFVDKTNPVSNHLYLALGFEIVTDSLDRVIEDVL